MKKVDVKKNIGHLPEPWNKDVIFFANLLSLFYGNESETEMLRKEVGSLESYGSRLIPLLSLLYKGPKSLLLLEKKADECLIDYFISDLKLTIPDTKVVTHDKYKKLANEKNQNIPDIREMILFLKSHPSLNIDGYVSDDSLLNIGRLTNKTPMCSMDGSRNGNNKLLLNDMLCKGNLPTFDTEIAENPDDVLSCCQNLKSKGYYACVVKAQIGASGIGMYKINLANSEEQIKQLPEFFFFEGPCLVQGWLDENVEYIGSPSVQLFVKHEQIILFDLTEQILSSESIHEGNMSPVQYLNREKAINELLIQAEISACWLHAQGYRGTASVDFHIIKRSDKLEVRVCEINARVTGATYPSILARNFLPEDAWLMRNLRFYPPLKSTELLQSLDKAGLIFKHDSKKGILPINFNPDSSGLIVKGQFLFLGQTLDEVERLMDQLKSQCDIKGDFDRD